MPLTIDHAVRHGVGDFDCQTFLANIESIQNATFSKGNIKSAFRKCSFIPYNPDTILCQIKVNSSAFEDESKHRQDNSQRKVEELSLPDVWSSPTTHNKLYQQAEAIENLLRSSVDLLTLRHENLIVQMLRLLCIMF